MAMGNGVFVDFLESVKCYLYSSTIRAVCPLISSTSHSGSRTLIFAPLESSGDRHAAASHGKAVPYGSRGCWLTPLCCSWHQPEYHARTKALTLMAAGIT